MTCVKCKEPKAHRSHRTGLMDWFYRFFQMIPYRCHACKARFYAYRAGEESASMRTGEERKVMALRRRMRWKRTRKELTLYGLGAIILILGLWFLMRQRV